MFKKQFYICVFALDVYAISINVEKRAWFKNATCYVLIFMACIKCGCGFE